ncbi:(2E,6E)-farnesyl diphosphate synthase [Candidatus Steffania adelgidicola]|uniref:(2E,6E)-farnesyl diphosphate synthase n=1 Tax=Candidatus Steffania adelgidicola TaxID=1076626 RepID=UPI001D01F38C|nr:(2E,6E)-farnesyl diphosphate synthase [Candidatus Steffania adelgidicola]UDG79820.1 Farnesyl diphosphate synthase [Candidatus Steffania adelgidicola]
MSDFARALEDSRKKVDAVLEHYLNALPRQQAPLIKAMRHGTLLGGKRLRPFLVYQTGRLFGLPSINLDAPAAAIECIHAYSLIHDDLPAMDNDKLRRGLPTCHVKFGETIAILAGDALQTLAFSILADAEMPEVSLQDRLKMISILASASGAKGMCLGQALDITLAEKQVSPKSLEIMHRHKTGKLIRAAVRLGMLAPGQYNSVTGRYLDRFAETIGLAFQVQDDILDIVGDSHSTRKQQGQNQKIDKITYPALLGLDMARVKAKALYDASLASLKSIASLGYNIAPLVALARYIIERDK